MKTKPVLYLDWSIEEPSYLFSQLVSIKKYEEKVIIPKKYLHKVEKILASDFLYAYLYASEVLKGRFEQGETSMASNDWISYKYAEVVLKGRFILGETAILKSQNSKVKTLYLEFLDSL